MAPTIRTVASYNTHEEHYVNFFGNEFIVTVTPTASVISQWINDVQYYNRVRYSSHPLVVGVGVQWTPAGFHSSPPRDSCYINPHNYHYNPPPANNYADPPPPGSNYADPPADTLQLCVGKRCIIIQLSHCDFIPDELRSFLVDPQATFVGVWNSQDAGKLARSRHGLEIGELLDIRHYVQRGNLRRCSFEEIVERCMGYEGVGVDLEISTSDWSVYDLCHEQILQASIDVFVCSELGVWVRLWEI